MKKMKLFLLAGTLLLASCAKKADTETGKETAAEKARPVKLTIVTQRTFEDRLQLQGNLEAKHYANVSPKLDGDLTEIRVDIGDAVEAGKTVLFVTDSRKRAQAKAQAEQAYLVACENYNVSKANIARAEASYDKAKKDRDRYLALYKSGNVTVNEKERFETEYLVADAALKLARATSMASKAQSEQAKVAFQIASQDLEDCTIKAPLTGIVMRRDKEPGEHAGTGKTVLRIEGIDVLEAVANVPGAYFSRITPNTTVHVIAEGTDAGILPVTYRADSIDPILRTFKIKALVKNTHKNLASGMMTDMTIIMAKRDGLAIPSHCIIERGQGNVVFLVNNGKAQELVVETGLVNEGYTEILSAKILGDDGKYTPYKLEKNTEVLVEGQYLVVHGDPVSVSR